MASDDLKNILYYGGMVTSIVCHVVFWILLATGGGNDKSCDDGDTWCIGGKIPAHDKECGGEDQFQCQGISQAFEWGLALSVITAICSVYSLIYYLSVGETDKEINCDADMCKDSRFSLFWCHAIAVILLFTAAAVVTVGNDAQLNDWAENVCIETPTAACIADPTLDTCAKICNGVTVKERKKAYRTIFYQEGPEGEGDDCDVSTGKYKESTTVDCVPMFEVSNLGTKKAEVKNDLGGGVVFLWLAAVGSFVAILKNAKFW